MRNNSLDILRIILALLVYVAHAAELSNTTKWGNINYSYFAVNCFFVLSGYLMTESYERSSSMLDFYLKRFKRIYILYALVILITLLIGVYVSYCSVLEYFSLDSFKYLTANLLTLNFLHPDLNCLFQQNPFKAVNGSLWTIKLELMFYLLVPFIYKILHVSKKNLHISLALLCLGSIVLSYYLAIYFDSLPNSNDFAYMNNQLPIRLCYFVAGWYLNYLQKEIKNVFYIILFLIIVAIIIMQLNIFKTGLLDIPFALVMVYVFSVMPSKLPENYQKYLGQLSYPIYLIHFPVIQFFVQEIFHLQWSLTEFLIQLLVTISFAILILHLESLILKVIKPFFNNRLTH